MNELTRLRREKRALIKALESLCWEITTDLQQMGESEWRQHAGFRARAKLVARVSALIAKCQQP